MASSVLSGDRWTELVDAAGSEGGRQRRISFSLVRVAEGSISTLCRSRRYATQARQSRPSVGKSDACHYFSKTQEDARGLQGTLRTLSPTLTTHRKPALEVRPPAVLDWREGA